MRRIITYAVDRDNGLVYSRVGDKVAFPVLQYERIGKGGDFTQPLEYELEADSVSSLAYYWPMLRWTKKVPVALKNLHRVYWGMKPLGEAAIKAAEGDR